LLLGGFKSGVHCVALLSLCLVRADGAGHARTSCR
jgi:hypothetical protein